MNFQSPKKDTKETKLEASLRLLFLPPLILGLEYAKYTMAGPWRVPYLPEKALAVLKQDGVEASLLLILRFLYSDRNKAKLDCSHALLK